MKKIIEYLFPEYENLRIENDRLRQKEHKLYKDLYTIVMKSDSVESLALKESYNIIFSTERIYNNNDYYKYRSSSHLQNMDGLFNQVEKQ